MSSLVAVAPRRRCACCRAPTNRCPCPVCRSCSSDAGPPGELCGCGPGRSAAAAAPPAFVVEGEPGALADLPPPAAEVTA
jgi:hypothetical protein